MRTYRDFNLRLVADGSHVRVHAKFDTKRVSSRSELPQTQDQPSGLRAVATLEGQKRIGRRLLESLFSDEIRKLWAEARALSTSLENEGLRIRIQLDLRDPRLRPLLDVPWELLFAAGGPSGFLALDPQTPIVRSLEGTIRRSALELGRPLRILVAMANPRRTDLLGLEEEWMKIEKAFQSVDEFRLSPLFAATRTSLFDRLRSETFDVVHFVGHADFDEQSGLGSLILEGPRREMDSITGAHFSTFFNGRPAPSLVVLNACETAKTTTEFGMDPFSGAAAALVAAGLPAVLAMQTSIRDDRAVRFAEKLYGAIARGESIEGAVTEARLALWNDDPADSAWASPALFLRSESMETARVKATEPNAESVNEARNTKPGEKDASSTPQSVRIRVGRIKQTGPGRLVGILGIKN